MKENREGQSRKLARPPFFLHLPANPPFHDFSPLSLLHLLPAQLHHTHATKARSLGDFHLFLQQNHPTRPSKEAVQGKPWPIQKLYELMF